MQQVALLGRGEARGAAARRRPRGPADAVDVVLGHVRQVEVHDVADVGDVDAAGGDVGRDEHAVGAVLEPVERHAAAAPASGRRGSARPCGRRGRCAFQTLSARRFVRVNTSVESSSRSSSVRSSGSFSSLRQRGTPAARRAPRSSRCAPPRRGRDRAGARGRSRRPRRAIVAEKSSVCRCFGQRARIRSSWGLKPMSSIRSASSRTSTSIPSSLAVPCSRWSTSRPGVAMTIGAALAERLAPAPPMPTPPMITAPRTRGRGRSARAPRRSAARARASGEDERPRPGLAGEPFEDRQEERGGLAGAGRGGADDVPACERRAGWPGPGWA